MNINLQGVIKIQDSGNSSKIAQSKFWETRGIRDGYEMERTLPRFIGRGDGEKVLHLSLIIEKYFSYFDKNSVQSWASEESRSIETGKSFLQGLEMDPEGIVVDNSKAVYYKGEFGCERYIQEVSDIMNKEEIEDLMD